MSRSFALVFFLFLFQLGHAQQNYTADQIPNPKSTGSGFVSDPDAILNDSDRETLNHTITQLENKTKVEIAVVVVRDFDRQEDNFNFALNLFKKWGIGKNKANNGLLLFIATDRKQYRFITGYGLEGLLPDAVLKRIGDRYLVPAFQKKEYSTGTVNALRTIADYLGQPENKKELEQLLEKKGKGINPWIISIPVSVMIFLLFIFIVNDLRKRTPVISSAATKKIIGYDKLTGIGCLGLIALVFAAFFIAGPSVIFEWIKPRAPVAIPAILYGFTSFILFFRYMSALSSVRKAYNDDQTFMTEAAELNHAARWFLISSPLILFGILAEERRRVRSVQRFKPPLDSGNQEMIRLNRDENTDGHPYLTKGQIEEEKLGASSYDIWLSKDQSQHQVIRQQGSSYNACKPCPECKFRTLGPAHIIRLTQPTYSERGTGKKVFTCTNCGYEELIKMIVIPKLSDSNNSSGSPGSSSGSGNSSSSSDSSSSWGGGSSGGGGAGGSW